LRDEIAQIAIDRHVRRWAGWFGHSFRSIRRKAEQTGARFRDNARLDEGGTMRTYVIAIAATVVAVSAGCAAPDPQKDAEAQPERIYRTGSNIPVKDYGAANIEVSKPDPADTAMRPGTGVLGRKPGG